MDRPQWTAPSGPPSGLAFGDQGPKKVQLPENRFVECVSLNVVGYGLRFEVWGVGFEVWGLGFGV